MGPSSSIEFARPGGATAFEARKRAADAASSRKPVDVAHLAVVLTLSIAIVGGWLLPLIGISWGGFWGSFFMALIGAIILILVFRLLRPGPG